MDLETTIAFAAYAKAQESAAAKGTILPAASAADNGKLLGVVNG